MAGDHVDHSEAVSPSRSGVADDVASPGRRRRALIALLLLVPAPSLGVLSMLHWFPGPVGTTISFSQKLWIALLPVAWLVWVDKRKPRLGMPSRQTLKTGLTAAVLSGLAIIAVMLGTFELVLPHLDLEPIRRRARETGFADPWKFAVVLGYIVLINSILEEYVWRWFVTTRFERLFVGVRGAGVLAVVCSALCFTVHHVWALGAWMPPAFNALASFGVFSGGVIWSAMYHHYRSVWPGYLSHLLADVAIAIMGWRLIFGG